MIAGIDRDVERGGEPIDVALAILRVGLGASCLFVHTANLGLRAALWLCAVLVACGVLTRVTSAAAAAGWCAALIGSLRQGTEWYLFPILATLYLILFAALALSGPGRIAIDRRLRRHAAVALLAILLSAPVRAESPCVPKLTGNPDRSYPIEIVSNKPLVQVRINDSKPHRFMLDTGSGAALIDPPLARSLGFQPVSESKGFFGVGNARSSLVLLKPTACQEMAGAAVADVHFLAFDLSLISSVEGVPVRGTVGSEFFNKSVVVIDYAHKNIRVLDPSSFDYRGDGIVLPVVIDRQIFTTVRIHKSSGEIVEGKFYLDTGTRTALSLNSPFVRNNHLLDGETVIPLATLGLGMGGESLASVYRIGEIELGPLRLHDVVATASLDEKGVFADPNVAGIIGGELLRKFTVILDYPHQRVILEKTPQSDAPFGYDAAGLFLLAEGAKLDRIRVLRVIAGSPADEAGLRKGDIIVSIDSKPARRLEEVRQLFRLEGRNYALQVRRGSKRMSVSIRTEDLLARPSATRRM
jgi:uncharacterized membrane protein YphA (DoxX/SURF4 family)